VASDIHRMAQEFKDDRVALISHGTFLDNLLKALTGRLPGHEFHYSLYNTSISRLDFTPSYQTGSLFTVVRYTNRVDHLSPDLIT
jgi:2,3-bisphosphoglycerate-dependent phosphoglycerate mutase/probable phosphoglycerate mutase